MTRVLSVLALVLAVIAQVTVAPRFPIAAAVPDLVLATLTAILVYGGPRRAMLAVPVAAVLLAFDTNRSAGLLVLAYVPLLPIAVFAQYVPVPMNRYAQSLTAALATGIWARGVLALGAVAGGASPQVADLILRIMIPGLLLDALALTALYVPFRIMGREARPLSLQRSGYYT